MRFERAHISPDGDALGQQSPQRGARLEHVASTDVLGQVLKLREARPGRLARERLRAHADGFVERAEEPLEPSDAGRLPRQRQFEAKLEATMNRAIEEL